MTENGRIIITFEFKDIKAVEGALIFLKPSVINILENMGCSSVKIDAEWLKKRDGKNDA
jgi:hypothetical protein